MLKETAKRIWRGNGKAGAFPFPLPVEENQILSQGGYLRSTYLSTKRRNCAGDTYHRARHIQQIIVDNNGQIFNFHGFFDQKEIIRHLENGMLPKPVIRFQTEFWKDSGGRFLMVWEVQQDGRYWEDENGFVSTSDLEVQLYWHIDRSGCFTDPFHLYKVGIKKLYCG